MKIRELNSEQFAGLRRKEPLRFEDGVNVVFGKNESGKSTLVNLVSCLLFEKTGHTGAAAKAFRSRYFPVTGKDSRIAADSAEGSITLETEDGDYTLSKVWGAGSSCRLDTPEVFLRDEKQIEEILKEILVYGGGVYSELLLSSQMTTGEALKAMLDPAGMKETKREITDYVSRAFAESDGLSVDEIEQKIEEIIAELAGNWDAERECPKQKSGGGRWQKGNGEVLQAYYAWKDAEGARTELKKFEDEAEKAAEACRRQEEETKKAREELEQFAKDAERLKKKRDLARNIQNLESSLNRMKNAGQNWPDLIKKEAEAKKLAVQQENCGKAKLYHDAKAVMDGIRPLKEKTEGKACPARQEILEVKQAEEAIRKENNKLSRMNIRAAVNMLGGHGLEVTSLTTGLPVEAEDGAYVMTEAVRISIPGVMEMQLAPADADVEAVQKKVQELEERKTEILARYGVKDPAALEALANELNQVKGLLQMEEGKLEQILKGKSFEEAEAEYRAVEGELRDAEEVERAIRDVCGTGSLIGFISKAEGLIQQYEADYGSIGSLQENIEKQSGELRTCTDEMEKLLDIPADYLGNMDPERHLETLRGRAEQKQQALEDARDRKRDTSGRLEAYQDTLKDDPDEALERTERIFHEKRELLLRWIHIREKLLEQKEQIREHPLLDLAEKFSGYLDIISGGRVSSELPDEDRLNVSILSNRRELGYDLLSEGTKDTISLAFRLAVVDHLFPEGGGVIVLDDPLTDMDEDRVRQSCELIREFAKRHQVIFLTCREEYQEKLQGNLIRL